MIWKTSCSWFVWPKEHNPSYQPICEKQIYVRWVHKIRILWFTGLHLHGTTLIHIAILLQFFESACQIADHVQQPHVITVFNKQTTTKLLFLKSYRTISRWVNLFTWWTHLDAVALDRISSWEKKNEHFLYSKTACV